MVSRFKTTVLCTPPAIKSLSNSTGSTWPSPTSLVIPVLRVRFWYSDLSGWSGCWPSTARSPSRLWIGLACFATIVKFPIPWSLRLSLSSWSFANWRAFTSARCALISSKPLSHLSWLDSLGAVIGAGGVLTSTAVWPAAETASAPPHRVIFCSCWICIWGEDVWSLTWFLWHFIFIFCLCFYLFYSR